MWCTNLVLTTFLGFAATLGSAQPGGSNLAEVAADNGLTTLLAAATVTGQAAAFTADSDDGLSKFSSSSYSDCCTTLTCSHESSIISQSS
jgi:hypothetical protein